MSLSVLEISEPVSFRARHIPPALEVPRPFLIVHRSWLPLLSALPWFLVGPGPIRNTSGIPPCVLHSWQGPPVCVSVHSMSCKDILCLPGMGRRTGPNMAPGWEHELLVSNRTYVRGPVKNVQKQQGLISNVSKWPIFYFADFFLWSVFCSLFTTNLIIFFLLLTLGLICSNFPSFLRWKRYYIFHTLLCCTRKHLKL